MVLGTVFCNYQLRISYKIPCLSSFSGSGLGDLHFFGVAMLLLSLHKLHMVLTVSEPLTEPAFEG